MTRIPSDGELSWSSVLRAFLLAGHNTNGTNNSVPVVYNVKDYVAIGDGVTDDTAAINAAVSACPTAGGTVYFPPGVYKITSTLTLKQNVTLLGAPAVDLIDGSHAGAAQIKGSTISGWMIDSSSDGVGLQGITVKGNSASGGAGVRLSGAGANVRDCMFDSFGEQALRISGVSSTVSNVFVQNAVLVRTGRAAYIGTVEIAGSDHIINGVTATASYGSGVGGHITFFIAGILVAGANNQLTNCIGHLSEAGIVLDTSTANNKLIGCRGDLNQTSGIVVLGNANQLLGCHSFRDSRDTNGAYDGFNVQGARNAFIACYTTNNSGETVQSNNGFGDVNSGTGANSYVECRTDNVRGVLLAQSGGTQYPIELWGSGAPALAAPVGSTYRRTDGGASTSFYVKESGTGSSGWVAK